MLLALLSRYSAPLPTAHLLGHVQQAAAAAGLQLLGEALAGESRAFLLRLGYLLQLSPVTCSSVKPVLYLMLFLVRQASRSDLCLWLLGTHTQGRPASRQLISGVFARLADDTVWPSLVAGPSVVSSLHSAASTLLSQFGGRESAAAALSEHAAEIVERNAGQVAITQVGEVGVGPIERGCLATGKLCYFYFTLETALLSCALLNLLWQPCCSLW